MKKSEAKITQSQLQALLDREWNECLRVSRVVVEPVPPGWETARQVAKRLRVALIVAQRALTAGVRAGTVVVRKFRVLSGKGTVIRLVPHYCPRSLAETPHGAQEDSFPRSD